MNKFKSTPDDHDFMEKDHIARFLRNHKTGTDNFGRKALARIVKEYNNPIVIDAACGTAVNWEVFRDCQVECNYIGVDRCIKLLDHARELYGDEIELREGHVQEIPEADNGADIVILRHILEHLEDGYQTTIKEALRVAAKEVVVVFFLEPSSRAEDEIIESEPDNNGCTHWWNTYSWQKFTEFIMSLGYKMNVDQVFTPGAAHHDTIFRIKK